MNPFEIRSRDKNKYSFKSNSIVSEIMSKNMSDLLIVKNELRNTKSRSYNKLCSGNTSKNYISADSEISLYLEMQEKKHDIETGGFSASAVFKSSKSRSNEGRVTTCCKIRPLLQHEINLKQ